MRIKSSLICLNLKQGTVVSILFDLLKIIVSIIMLILYVTVGWENGLKQTTTMSSTSQVESLQKTSNGNVFAKIVLFSGEVLRYSVVGVVGVIAICRKFRVLAVGFYFWVKFLQTFLNVFA